MQTLEQHRITASDLSLGSSHEGIYSKAIALFKELQLASGQHLDFGSGQGTLLARLSEIASSGHLSGVDLMAKPQGLGDDVHWKQADLNLEMPFSENQFDSITAIEIIEHLENPRHFFREINRVLKPGGVLIMSTPNIESWRSIISMVARGSHVAFTKSSYPAHITPVGREDIKRAAQEANLKWERWEYCTGGRLPGFTKLSWQNLSAGLLSGRRYSDNVFGVFRAKS